MSDRYRGPKGPNRPQGDNRGNKKPYPDPMNKGKPSYNRNNDTRNPNFDKRENGKFTPTGPKRYSDRDNYRPPNPNATPINHANKGKFPDDSRSGPSQNTSNGYNPSKRPYPSDSKNNSNYNDNRSSSSYVNPKYNDKNSKYPNKRPNKITSAPNNINNLPKGPKLMGKETYNGKDKYNGNDAYNGKDKYNTNDKYNGKDSYNGKQPYNENPHKKFKPSGPSAFKASNGHQYKQSGPSQFQASNPVPVAPPSRLAPHQIYSIKAIRPGELYQRIQQVGEGTYGKVYKAKNSITQETVALKKLRLETEREGFPITSIREIKLLQSFDHPNVVGLLEMMVESNQIFMIFDYMEHDLTGLLTHPSLDLQESHRKYMFKQLMEGLSYLHHKRVIHRDIKGSNILVNNIGNLKIADLGLARTMKLLKEGESPDYTNRVITIWYRPPELLLGCTDYGREIDIWGVGCLLIELYTKMATFQGFDEVGQLNKIFNIMGTPNLEDWPEIQNLPWFEMLKPKINKTNNFEKTHKPLMTDHSFDLAVKLLNLNPTKRLTAAQALTHPYFTEEPKPEPLYFLKDIQGEWHEFETKKRRRQERKRLQDQEKLKQQEAVDVNQNIAPSGPKSESHVGGESVQNSEPNSVAQGTENMEESKSINTETM